MPSLALAQRSSFLGQSIFSFKNWIRSARYRPESRWRFCARIADRAMLPVWNLLASKRPLVQVRMYGRRLLLNADHRLPDIVAAVPMFNAPIIDAVTAIVEQHPEPVVIDVGANIGDTVALIEAHLAGRCSYLCIEPDSEFEALCRYNLRTYKNAHVNSSLVGDVSEATAVLVKHRPGTAATEIRAAGSSEGGNVTPLDVVAESFIRNHGFPQFIKIDTDGFDFAVLRSASGILAAAHPALLFEWHPKLWLQANEDIAGVFTYLAEFGYEDFVFFDNQGSLHCSSKKPQREFIDCLAKISLARHRLGDFHYDVFAATSAVCSRVVDLALARMNRN